MSRLITTEGIVLHTTPYSEHSMVARIFTRQLGIQSCMVRGVRSRNGHTKQNQLQPLEHIELTLYHNPRHDIHHVKEMRVKHPVTPDIVQTALRFFKAEVLYKTLRPAEPQPNLFDYVAEESDSPCPIAHQPLVFLLGLSRHLGIEPLDNYDEKSPLFSPEEGCFISERTMGLPTSTEEHRVLTFTAEESLLFHQYLQVFHRNAASPSLTTAQRENLFEQVLKYYDIHLEGFGRPKSVDILHTILH